MCGDTEVNFLSFYFSAHCILASADSKVFDGECFTVATRVPAFRSLRTEGDM